MAHCWAMDCWMRTPRLLFVSPEPKLRQDPALEVTQHLVPRPENWSANLTQAALYQSIEDAVEEKGGRPTILHDQLDKLFGNGETAESATRKVENSSNRLPPQRHHQPQDEGPLQAVQRLRADGAGRDDGLERRTRHNPLAQPHHPMQRHCRERAGTVEQRRHSAEAESLCWLLRYWVEFIHDAIREHQPAIPESLTNRDIDKWEPLFVMADLAGGRWPELARVTAVTAVTASEVKPSPARASRLLEAIQTIFDRTQSRPHLHRRTGGRVGQNRRIRLVKMACSARRNARWRTSSRGTESVAVPSATARKTFMGIRARLLRGCLARYPPRSGTAVQRYSGTDGGGRR